MKKTPSHQLFAYKIQRLGPFSAKWPLRNMRSNISIQIQVKLTTTPRVAKPRAIRLGLAARIFVENSRNADAAD